jgi:hypothetical protein
LDPNGELQLASYQYVPAPKNPPLEVHETLTGDFWLVLKRHFFGPRVYVPFRGGRIVEDATAWVREPSTGNDEPWEPPNPAPKLILPEPVYLFTVEEVREDPSGIGVWLARFHARGTCIGSRAQLRFPDGRARVVRLNGISSRGLVLASKPRPLGEGPLGTRVWLLETTAADFEALTRNDPTLVANTEPVAEPVDRELRRRVRARADEDLSRLADHEAHARFEAGRSEHPAQLADGSWVVFDLHSGHRILFRPEQQSYRVEILEGAIADCVDLAHALRAIAEGRL